MLVVVIIGIGVKSLSVPFFRRCLIEVRVWKESQADNAGAVTIIGSDRNIFSSRADLYSWIFLLILEGIGGTILAVIIQPQAETIGSGSLRFLEAGFVHQTEIFPARIPAEMVDLRMR